MITLLEKEIAQEIAMGYERFKIISLNPVKINFRCPHCGDSARRASMTRGWFYEHDNILRYGCFNCNYNLPIGSYLKEHFPEHFRNWLRDRRGSGNTERVESEQREKNLFSIKKPVIESLPECENLADLSDEHPAKKYMLNRMIPRDKLSLFWFTMNWKKVANSIVSDTYEDDSEAEPRIVIPIRNREGKIESVQGRALRKSDNIRYLTIKVDEHSSKIFGVERVSNDDKPVFVFEGPIDSVFIHNGIAMAGGQVDPNVVPFRDRRVWVLDNENRSPDTMTRYQKLIDLGESVVMWDKAPWLMKDINDMVQKENANPLDIYDYLCNNIVSGLRATNRFSRWKKNERKSNSNRESKSTEHGTANLRDQLKRRSGFASRY